LSWINRGDASAPRSEPKIVVDPYTVRMIFPKRLLLTFPTGVSKLGWFNTLKNCAPIPNSPDDPRVGVVCGHQSRWHSADGRDGSLRLLHFPRGPARFRRRHAQGVRLSPLFPGMRGSKSCQGAVELHRGCDRAAVRWGVGSWMTASGNYDISPRWDPRFANGVW
jgi:hypothetical protein